MHVILLLLVIGLVQSVRVRVVDGVIVPASPEEQNNPRYRQALRDLGHEGADNPSPTIVTRAPRPTVTDPCLRNVPDALSFIEPLNSNLKPSEIVLFSGGHSYERRSTGFGAVSSEQLKRLAGYHGYQLVFLDELDYERVLIVNGTFYAPQWHKIFAFEALGKRFPYAKYYVWLDDDILSLFPESDMLNHYINIVEADPNIELLIGDDIQTQVLNTGMYIMRNTEFIADLMQKIILMGLEDDGYLARTHFHEQGGLKILRVRLNIEDKVPIIKHRDGPYNFNTFHGVLGNLAKHFDAFVHHVCCTAEKKEKYMNDRLALADIWRYKMPQNCTYPVNVPRI